MSAMSLSSESTELKTKSPTFQTLDEYVEHETTFLPTKLLEATLSTLPLPKLGPFLKRHHGVLAGSFLFQFIMEKKFVPDDIDLFFGDYAVTNAVNELHECGWSYRQTKHGFSDYMGPVKCEYKLFHPKSEYAINIIVYNAVSIQEQIKQKIFETFDLDGCTLQWHGKNEWFIHPSVNWNDFVSGFTLNYNLDQLKTRLLLNATIDDIKRVFNHVSSYYIFDHTTPNPRRVTDNDKSTLTLETYQRQVTELTLKRIKKYQDRGYVITGLDDVYKLTSYLNVANVQ